MPSFSQRVAIAARAAIKSFQTFGGASTSMQALQREIAAGAYIGGVPIGEMRISTDSLYTMWRNHGDVFAAVREISQSVGVAGGKWVNVNDPSKDPNPESVRRATEVFTRYQTMRQFWRDLTHHERIAGNAYYHLEKNQGDGAIFGLKKIDPRTMAAVIDPNGNVIKWIQQVGLESVTFEPDEIVHFTTIPDPNSPVYGISPLESIMWEARTDIAAMISNYSLFMNDATPASMYVFEDAMTDKQVAAAIEKIKEQVRGVGNRHKSLGMKGLKDIKTISITNKDMEFTVLRKMTTEKVCAAYGVPKSILGYTEDVNLANGQEQTKKFWEGSVGPQEEAEAEWVNRNVLPKLGISDIRWEFETREFDDREWNESSSRADLMVGVMTVNEVRERRGLEPYDESEHPTANVPIIFAGLSARPLEDIGIDLSADAAVANDQAASKAIQKLDLLGRAYVDPKHTERTR